MKKMIFLSALFMMIFALESDAQTGGPGPSPTPPSNASNSGNTGNNNPGDIIDRFGQPKTNPDIDLEGTKTTKDTKKPEPSQPDKSRGGSEASSQGQIPIGQKQQ